MGIAAHRIWAFHDGPMVGLFIGQKEVGTNVAGYVREDIYEELKAENARLREALASKAD